MCTVNQIHDDDDNDDDDDDDCDDGDDGGDGDDDDNDDGDGDDDICSRTLKVNATYSRSNQITPANRILQSAGAH